MFQAVLTVCGLTHSTSLLLSLENEAGRAEFPVQLEVETLPSKLQLPLPATEWIQVLAFIETPNTDILNQQNVFQSHLCSVLGVAAGAALLMLLAVQAGLLVRHRRHGCRRFETNKIAMWN